MAAENSELTIVVRARDQASAIIQKVRDEVGTRFYGSLQKAEQGSMLLAGGLIAAGAATAGLGVVALKAAGNYEQQRVAFETMLGSADRARKMMSDIAEFAKSTPFELPQVVQASKQLLAFGFEQEQIIPTMRRLGDIAAGVGVPVGQLAYVFGQVRVAGKLMGGDLMQFTNAGVPMIEQLAKVLNVSQGEVKKLVEQGKVGFPEVEKAIMSLTDEGSRFGGMMDKQSKTLDGVISNIKDGFGQALRSMVGITAAGDIIEGGLFDKIKTGAEKLMPIIQNIPQILSDGFQKLQPFIPAIAGAIMIALVPAFLAWGVAAWAAITPLLPFLAIGAAIGVLIKFLVDKMGGWSAAWEKLQAVVGPVLSALGQVAGFVGGVLKTAINGLVVAWNFLWPSIKSVGEVFMNNLLPALRQIWDAVTRLWNALNPALMDALKIIGIVVGVVVVGAILLLVGAVWVIINVLKIAIGVFSAVVSVISNVVNWIANLISWYGNLVGATIDMVGAVIGWFSRLPENVGNIVGAVVGWFAGLPKRVGDVVGGIVDILTAPFRTAFNAIAGLWNDSIGKLSFQAPDWVPGIGGKGFSMPKLPMLAKGVEGFEGGFAITGEKGPELAYWPRGTNIMSHDDMKEALRGKSGGGSGDLNIHFHGPVYMRDEAEVEDVAGRLARQLLAARAGSH